MSVKLTELKEPRLEASEPRLEARDPRLLPEDTVRVLADRLKRKSPVIDLAFDTICVTHMAHNKWLGNRGQGPPWASCVLHWKRAPRQTDRREACSETDARQAAPKERVGFPGRKSK